MVYIGSLLGLECQTCGALLDMEEDQRTTICAYCASPAVVERPPRPERPNPGFAMGFVVTPEQARTVARHWVRGAVFAPQAFRKAELTAIRGVYVPAYLYTAAAHSHYQAEIGENYTVVETYTTTDSKGNRVTRTRTRTKTEWRSLAGRHAIYVSDRVVTASRGLPNAELEAIEPFDLRALHRYTPKLISGWITEEPSLLQAECLALARDEARASVDRALAAFMPGDKHRDLRHDTELHAEDLSLALLPVWILPVRYAEDKPVVRLLVNGQTGRVWGKAPVSPVKVAVVVLAVLLVILAIFLLSRQTWS